MLIEKQQITALEQRLGHRFSDVNCVVYYYTLYFMHYYYAKRGSLFKDHQLPAQNRPVAYKTLGEYLQAAKQQRQYLESAIVALVAVRGDAPARQGEMVNHILEQQQLWSVWASRFCLTREEDPEFAKAQALWIVVAVSQDFVLRQDEAGWQAWLSTQLTPYIDKAVAARSPESLLQEIVALQHSVSELHEQMDQLLADSDYWQEQVSLLQGHKFDLQQENASFQQQMLRLQQENALLQRHTAYYAQPAFRLPPARMEPMEQSFSSMVVTAKVLQDTFNTSVLKLATELTQPLSLVPIRGCLTEGTDTSEYFQQYIPYIREELRAAMEARLTLISKKYLRPFAATLQEGYKKDNDSALVRISACTRELPKLDHGFYLEAVLILLAPSASAARHRNGRGSAPQQQREHLAGVLAIASLDRQRDEDDDADNQEDHLSLVLPKQEYDKHRGAWQKQGLEIHWLVGLIPASRMYQVCRDMPKVGFEQQFIYGKLPAWPADEVRVNDDAMLGHLNDTQRRVGQSLQIAQAGLYFLQGPPGTGKTTTVVSLLRQWVITRPEQRILVCAPSNQAVRVVLSYLKVLLPELPMALTGIGKDLADEMSDVFVHKYAKRLYDPLILVKKQLKTALSVTPALAVAITAAYQQALDKLDRLIQTPTRMVVMQEIKEKMQKLLADVRGQQPAMDLSVVALIDVLEQSILTLKQNAHVIESFLVQRAHIVFATLVASGREWLRKQVVQFPRVIMDEASQALAPEALIPLRFAPKVYVQVGDPKQLPATVTSKAAQVGGYANSMMHWLEQEPYRMLDVQYRMHPRICAWPSAQYYGGNLQTAAGLAQRPTLLPSHVSPVFHLPCVFFDVKGKEDRRGDEWSASICNEAEAVAVVHAVGYLLLTCGIQATQLGVITFYAAQVELIKQKLHQTLGKQHKWRDLVVSTVDGFQGQERDMTLISVVRTSESVGFLNDSRRINVALTRAKQGRWVFGDFASLSRSNSDLATFTGDHSAQERVDASQLPRLMPHR